MGWYDEEWQYRAQIAVDNSTAPVATPDVTIVVAPDYDLFWDKILASGDDIRVTEADGETLTAYSLSGFNYANKTLTLEVDAAQAEAVAGVYSLFLYWGNANAADASSATTIASPKTGRIDQGQPANPQFLFRPIRAGGSVPENTWSKGVLEELDIWWNIGEVLRSRRNSSAGRNLYEEVFSVVVGVQQASISQPSMFEQGSSRIIDVEGQTWVAARVLGGTSGDQYTVNCRVKTFIPNIDGSTFGVGRVIESQVRLFVQDPSEA